MSRTDTVEAASVPVAFFEVPGLKDVQTRLSNALKDFMDKVGKAIQDAATLEVKTYVSEKIEEVSLLDGTGDLKLRAMTAIALDGDITVCVPLQGERIDQELWAAHVGMVAQAQANRTELIKMALAAASGIVSTVKPI